MSRVPGTRGGHVWPPLLILVSGAIWAGGADLPQIAGVISVASVNGDPVGVDEYLAALAKRDAATAQRPAAGPVPDPDELLERLVQRKLVVQEARAMGLDALPEYQQPFLRFRQSTLRDALYDRALHEQSRPDLAEVDALYRERMEEVEVALVMFADRAEAEAFVAALGEGADFAARASEWVSAGRAKRYEKPTFVRRAGVTPAVAAALVALEPGRVTAPIELANGFVVLRVSARRVPENAIARAGAENEVGMRRRVAAIRAYVADLRSRYVRTDEELLTALDFDPEAPGYQSLLADERVVVHVEGGEPVRIRDLAEAQGAGTPSGLEPAAAKQRRDKAKTDAVERLTVERLLRAEAARQQIPSSPDFAKRIVEYENEALFELFVRRVLEPTIRVGPSDIEAYFEAHRADYDEPVMVRLESLAFGDATAAARALELLRGGAELRQVRAQAAGQLEASSVPEELRYDNRLLVFDDLPPGVRDALAGATSGAYLLYAETPARHHVLFVRDRLERRPRSLDEVRDEVTKHVTAAAHESALAAWTAQKRETAEIRVFADAARLRDLAGRSGQNPAHTDR